MSAANSFISLGLKDAGYEYGTVNRIFYCLCQTLTSDTVNIDDCWAQMARVDGKMVADTNKFPTGISGVATKIHALGLKVGIYSDAGSKTCSGEKRRPIQDTPS